MYKSGIYEFDCESAADAEKQSRPVVYANAGDLLDKVIESRELVGNFCIKAMADGGQNFLKISLCYNGTFTCENLSIKRSSKIRVIANADRPRKRKAARCGPR